MKRVVTALILVAIFIYVILFSPQWLFLAVACLVALCAFREYASLVGLHRIPAPGLFGYAAGLAVMILPGNPSWFLILIALFAMALGLRVRELRDALPQAACLLLGVLYVFGSLRTGVELRVVSPWWLFFALSLSWVGDIAAYYVGRKFGRHKLSPAVSPGKSWEGAVASVVASTLYGAVYLPSRLPDYPLLEGLMIAVVANVGGQVGDLAESALKRGAGVKDSGSMLPGHGGWLDRIDSSLFAMPLVYVLLRSLG